MTLQEYEGIQEIIVHQKVAVEARNKAEAIKMIKNGKGMPLNSEYKTPKVLTRTVKTLED